MKINRYKKVKRILKFYANNYGFHEPYQVLVDGTFCHAALQNQINIRDQLVKYFQAELKLLTTQCVIVETENLGGKVLGASKIVKQFPVHKCGHEKAPKSGSNCLLSMIKNNSQDRYIIATQDTDLQEKIRRKPASPLLYLYSKTPCLEKPSDVTKFTAQKQVDQTFGLKKADSEVLSKLKNNKGIIGPDPINKKKNRKKGPNPLSCKKKKKKDVPAGVKKRSRNRIRIPKDLKSEVIV